jgi:hypothetical protein
MNDISCISDFKVGEELSDKTVILLSQNLFQPCIWSFVSVGMLLVACSQVVRDQGKESKSWQRE